MIDRGRRPGSRNFRMNNLCNKSDKIQGVNQKCIRIDLRFL